MIDRHDDDNPADAGACIWSKHQTNDGIDETAQMAVDSEIKLDGPLSTLPIPNLGALTIGLIDFHRLTQDCLAQALEGLHSHISPINFTTVKDCITAADNSLDLIIYYLHGSEFSEATVMQSIAALVEAFPAVPVMAFSDADGMQQSKIMRLVLKSGARGFVPTLTASLSITLAAIRFVKAGGTFVPVDLLLSARPDRTPGRQNRLTSRQVAVLSHLQQGKANKIIAYELGMSESTVKVHVRNIMRKMGATNRTQAAYKAQRLLSDFETAKAADI